MRQFPTTYLCMGAASLVLLTAGCAKQQDDTLTAAPPAGPNAKALPAMGDKKPQFQKGAGSAGGVQKPLSASRRND